MANFYDQYNAMPDQSQPVALGAHGSSTATAPAKKTGGGIGGFIKRAGSSLIQAPEYFGRAGRDLGKETAALATGNHQALSNAANQTIGDLAARNKQGNVTFGGTAKRFGGNLAQIASFAVPETKAIGLGGKVAQGAKIGALAGGGSAAANNQDILTGAVEGAATGGAANGILSKVLKPKLAGTTAIDTARTSAAKSAMGARAPLASSATKMQKYGRDLIANGLNVSAKDAAKFKGPETVQTLFQKYGLTPHQAAELHPVITGAEGTTTEAGNNALENMGHIKFNDFGQAIRDKLNDPEFMASNNITSSQAKNLRSLIGNFHDRLNDVQPGVLTKTGRKGVQASGTNAKNAMDIAKELESKGIQNGASTSETKNGLGDLQHSMADFIKSRIYNSPGSDAALQEAKTNAAEALDKVATDSGNPAVSKVANDIRAAKSFKDFRNVSAPFVNAKKLADKTSLNDFANANNDHATGLVSTAQKIVGKTVGPVVGKAMLKAAPATENASGFLNTLTRVNPRVAGLARRAATSGAAEAVGNPPAETAQSAAPADDNIEASIANFNANNPATDQGTAESSTTPFTSDNIERAILADIAANGGKNISALTALYNTFGKPQDTLTTNQKNEVTGSQKAEQALSDYASQLDSVGGGRGPVVGKIENFAGKFGIGGSNAAAAHALESQRIDVATSVAAALTPTGRPTASITKQIADSLPTINDTSATAQYKLQQLMTRIQNGEFAAQQPLGQ